VEVGDDFADGHFFIIAGDKNRDAMGRHLLTDFRCRCLGPTDCDQWQTASNTTISIC
jgi:hypothetical protein